MLKILVFGMTKNMGGVEQYLMNIYRTINREDIQFSFVVDGQQCHFEEEIIEMGGVIYYITPKKSNILINIYEYFKVIKKCSKNHDIFYFNFSSLYYNVAFLLSLMYRPKVIVSHAHNTKSPKSNKIYDMFHYLNRSLVTNKSDRLFQCSEFAGDWVFGKSAKNKKEIISIPNAIDIDKFEYNEDLRNKVREQLNIEEKMVIGHVGRFSYQKNHKLLIKIFNEVYKLNDDVVLLLIGEGELEKEIRSLIDELGLENNVLFLGLRNDVNELMQAMDVFILPSKFEGLGIVLIEAQTSGLFSYAIDGAVPREAAVTNLLEYISSEASANLWAKKIMAKGKNYDRKDYKNEIDASGFNIKSLATKLENIFKESAIEYDK